MADRAEIGSTEPHRSVARGAPVARDEAGADRAAADLCLDEYLRECRQLVLDELGDILPPDHRHSGGLYRLMLEYPLREAKGLRPALSIAVCRALGGRLQAVARSAAVLELYHNAFLIHDDVEDDSEKRRSAQTLHREHGKAIAINVGDGMLALALAPLLDNMRLIGMGRALRLLQVVGDMARETAEGQAIELEWIRAGRWSLCDREYLRMIYKKSAYYSFVTPATIGALCAEAGDETVRRWRWFATELGLAFQIQDDILNLAGDEGVYGKEINGDLWEGKRTMILLHMMRCAAPEVRERAAAILAKPRPIPGTLRERGIDDLIDELAAQGELSARAASSLHLRLAGAHRSESVKQEGEVRQLRRWIDEHRSLDHAREQADLRARRARRSLDALGAELPASVHVDFLRSLVAYVVSRNR